MKYILLSTGVILILLLSIYLIKSECFAHPHFSVPVSNHTYRLSWSDEFNDKTIDSTKWSRIERVPWSWGCHMSILDDLYELKHGRLRLYCKRNDGIAPNDTAPYLTGGISSQNKKTVKFGKVEVRARVHNIQGTWPAIWMKPNDPLLQKYPHRAEIDLVEIMNDVDYCDQTVHTNYTYILKQTNPPNKVKPPIHKDRYNTFCVEITPEAVVFSVNGSITMVYPKIDTPLEGQYPFGVESFIMLDMQVGGTYRCRHVEPSALPAYIDIDWIRVYDLIR